MTEAIANADYEKIARGVKERQRCFDELKTKRGEYMNACKGVRERLRSWGDFISDAGGDIKAIKYNEELDRRQKALNKFIENTDDDVIESAEAIKIKLGEFADLPLGAAAVQAAEVNEGKAASTPKTRGKGKKGADKTDMSAANKAEALGVGDGDEADLRGKRQREREDQRKTENEERLKGIKSLDQPLTH